MGRDSDFDVVDDKIAEFNSKYPQPELRIDYEDVQKAFKRRREMLMKSERGYSSDKRTRDLDVLQEPSLNKLERETQ
jgi:hypothetical protein